MKWYSETVGVILNSYFCDNFDYTILFLARELYVSHFAFSLNKFTQFIIIIKENIFGCVQKIVFVSINIFKGQSLACIWLSLKWAIFAFLTHEIIIFN